MDIAVNRQFVRRHINYRLIPLTILGGAFVVLMAYVFAFFFAHLSNLADWKVFWGVSITNPYDQSGFLNPWWASWALALPHLLTRDWLIGYGLWTLATFATAMFVLRDDKFLMVAGMLSPYFLHQVVNGQIDLLVVLGYYLLMKNSPYAPALMLVKPQSMIGSFIVWGWANIREKIVWQSLAIIGGLALTGFALYGNWISDLLRNVQNGLYQPVNAAWAFNCPLVGTGLLAISLWRKNALLGGLATLFLTPYIAMHSLWVYWTAWLMSKPNKYLVVALALLNWYIAVRFT